MSTDPFQLPSSFASIVSACPQSHLIRSLLRSVLPFLARTGAKYVLSGGPTDSLSSELRSGAREILWNVVWIVITRSIKLGFGVVLSPVPGSGRKEDDREIAACLEPKFPIAMERRSSEKFSVPSVQYGPSYSGSGVSSSYDEPYQIKRYKPQKSRAWDLGMSDPEVKRKKRVASYKVFTVEGKVKASVKSGFYWIKNKYIEVRYGWW